MTREGGAGSGKGRSQVGLEPQGRTFHLLLVTLSLPLPPQPLLLLTGVTAFSFLSLFTSYIPKSSDQNTGQSSKQAIQNLNN